MIKKIIVVLIGIIIFIVLFFSFRNNFVNIFSNVKDYIVNIFNDNVIDDEVFNYIEDESILKKNSDIKLTDVDGNKMNYTFVYKEQVFEASYTYDNWHIVDSYKVKSKKDMVIICEALIGEHKVHGIDMESYRTADDMAYEWLQHNMVYEFFPVDSSWRNSAKSVDLDPKDQGKSLVQMYEERTGEAFSISKIFK